MTVCTGATVNIYEDGKQIADLKARVENLSDQLEWRDRQLDSLREANHQTNNSAELQRECLKKIRERLDQLGSHPVASDEYDFIQSVEELVRSAGFPKVQLPAVVPF